MMTVLGMVAEIERKFILERQRAAIEAAKTKGGIYKGGKLSVLVEEVRKLHGRAKGPLEIDCGPGRVPHERLAGAEYGQ